MPFDPNQLAALTAILRTGSFDHAASELGVTSSAISQRLKMLEDQVGAALEGAPSCNGWTYWAYKKDGKKVPIDVLRQQIRAEMN